MGSSGTWLTSASAAPVVRTMAPAVPAPRELATLKRSCHRRRVLRSRKKVFQSRGGSDELVWALAADWAAVASRSWSLVAGRVRGVEVEMWRMRVVGVGLADVQAERCGRSLREMETGATGLRVE